MMSVFTFAVHFDGRRQSSIILFICMTSLAFRSQGNCEAGSEQIHQLKRRVVCLEREADILSKIIRINEATFEEINELVFQELESSQKIATHQLTTQHNHLHNPTANPSLQEQIHHEIAAQISQLVTGYQQNFLKVYEAFMNDHKAATNRLKRQLAEEGGRVKKSSEAADCDTSIEEHTSGKAIFQVPIELQVLKEMVDYDVQVNMLSSSKSIYQVPVQLREIFEVPIELNQIFQVPVELSLSPPTQKYRIFQVPIQMQEVIEVPVELDLEEEALCHNKIVETPVFLQPLKSDINQYEQQNAKLRLQIAQLAEQLAALKKQLSQSPRRIFEIPVELQPIPETDLNSSQCEVYLPELESQKTLERSDHPMRYDSVKQSSRISTQINTRPDLELSPLKERSEDKSSIILSNTTPMQQSLTYVPAQRPSTLKNINFFVSSKQISQVESGDEGNEVTHTFGDVPVEIEIDGETVEIEMQIVQNAQTVEQEAQTDPVPQHKSKRIAKIPFVKVVEVPYQVERVVEKFVKIPMVKVVEVPVQTVVQKFVKLPVLQVVQVPVQKATALCQQQQKVGNLCSANDYSTCTVVEVPVELLVQKIVVKEVPIEVIVEKQLPPKTIVKEVPIEIQIERIVEVPKLIIKEVPIEVIVEKEVIVQKIVQLPPKTIIKEVPIEVMVDREVVVERIVHLPPIIKEVPIQVIVEKQVIIQKFIQLPQKTIIKEVPVEVVVQKVVQVAAKTIIKEVPIEVIVPEVQERILIQQVPVQIVVEKEAQVKVVEIREVPIELMVEKEVQIIREIPYEVQIYKQIQKIVEVEKIVQVPVQVIREVPVELIVEVEREILKIVKEVVEVPVLIYMPADPQPSERDFSPLVESDEAVLLKLNAVQPNKSEEPIVNQLLLQSNCPAQREASLVTVVEVPVQVVVEKVIEVPVELLTQVEVIKNVPKLMEIPTELILVEQKEKIVYVAQQRISEVPVQVIIEKPVYIQRIVEVPVQVIVEKEVIVKQIVEVPVEVIVYRDRLIEIPLQMLPEPQQEQLIQQPVQAPLNQLKFVEIPVEIILQDKDKDRLQSAPIFLHGSNNQFTASQVAEIRSANYHGHHDYEITYQIPTDVKTDGEGYICNIDASKFAFSHDREIIIEIPLEDMRSNQADNEAQTECVMVSELAESKPASEIAKLEGMESQQCEVTKEETGVQTVYQEKVRVVELPIQVENIDYQQIHKDIENKYKEYLLNLNQRYGGEINELSNNIANLQSIIVEANAEKEALRERMENEALREQSLLKELQLMTNHKEEAFQYKIKQLEEHNHSLGKKIDQLSEEICRLQDDKENGQHRHHIYEVMVEVQTCKETQEQIIQTEHIQLALPDVLEIPIQLQLKQFIEEVHLEEYQEEQIHEQQKIEKVKASNMPEFFTVEVESQTEIKKTADYNPQTDQIQQEHQIQVKQSPNTYGLIQIPTEILQRVIYEVPTELKLLTDTDNAQTQTDGDFQQLPIQIIEAEIQTEGQFTSEKSSHQEEEEEVGAVQREMSTKHKHKHPISNNDSSFKKKKHYSEYFPSRIFEIPVELNLKHDAVKALLSTEVQTETSELAPVLSEVYLSRQRQIVASHLRIVPAFEPVKLAGDAGKSPSRRSPDRRIMRFGSDTENLGVNPNFSNVQSLTPNQLDGSSSLDKFPIATININNISVIKKSSIHSDNKFFGSLDMREELLNHDDALASVRMANRKLTGFQQGDSSSEEGDIHNLSREMIIEENETIVSRDINRIQTPNLEPHDLNFSEYATLQQKMYECEEEKVNYQQLYDNAHAEMDALRHKLHSKNQELAELKLDLDRETSRYEDQLRKAAEQLAAAHKLMEEQEGNLEAAKIRVAELQQAKSKLEKQIEMLFQNWEKLKEDSEKNEVATQKEFERLRAIISEKVAEIRELKADEHHQKDAFEAQLQEHREAVKAKTIELQELEEQLQRKNDRIDQLTDSLEEMRKNINSHSEQDTAAIYEQEFERVKEAFEEEKREMNYHLYELKQQNQELNDALSEEHRKREQLEAMVTELEHQVREARQEYSSLHHLKSELQNNFVEGVKCLNQELQEMKGLVREKDQIIQQHLPNSNPYLNPNLNSNTNFTPTSSSPFRIEYLSKQASQLVPDTGKQVESYSRKLENLLKKYQRIILENQGTIEQLQQKVYEYLKDALEKEQEAEGLYMKLVDYENTISNILVEKVSLDIENKRLSKQIELSEKKLKVLGSRLIEVARNRAEYDSDEDYYYD